MSKNGGFLDIVYDDPISRRGLTLRPHPKQVVLEGIQTVEDDRFPDGHALAPMIAKHECACWLCHPEMFPDGEVEDGTVSVRKWLKPRFWKTTLDGQPCGFVKEAKPGRDGYVWLTRTPIHACSCKQGYSCTVMLHGNVTVTPDGDNYD